MENIIPLLTRAREYASNFTERLKFHGRRFREDCFKEMTSLEEKINDASDQIELDLMNKQAYFSLGKSLYSLFWDNYAINKQVDEKILNDSIEALSKVKEIFTLENSRKVSLDSLIDDDKELLIGTLFCLSKAYLEKVSISLRNNDKGNAYYYLGLAETNKDITISEAKSRLMGQVAKWKKADPVKSIELFWKSSASSSFENGCHDPNPSRFVVRLDMLVKVVFHCTVCAPLAAIALFFPCLDLIGIAASVL